MLGPDFMLSRIFLIILSFGLAACVPLGAPPTDTKNSLQSASPQIDAGYLLSGRAIFGRVLDGGDLPEQELISASPSMMAFLEQLSPNAPLNIRWAELVSRFNRDQFVVEYDAQTTLSAAETFQLKTGNCLAVTMLLVSLTRELGIKAYFNQVETPQLWKLEDEQTLVNYRHINMVAEVPYGRKVVDFGLAEYDPTMYQQRISDRAAFSQYYSNRAMEVMRADGDREYAFKLMQKALQLAPGDSDIWLNLGALYKRFGLNTEAEQSYLLAIQLDSHNTAALSSLSRLYGESGNDELAAEYNVRAHAIRNEAPSLLYYRAKKDYDRGNFLEALTLLNRAAENSREDHRVYFLLGKTEFKLGRLAESKRHLVKAFDLLDDQSLIPAYQRELNDLQNSVSL
ncbi:tetratricopeptide repeat protein [Microbulbifer salipaludis]|uniref:Tetratricopeptide repeat protein n=1 Tax=Microbulbifer salipaludis TaxID=187980 RepID=A0ABS3E5P7_9GAMM|nr:tetratricopeptide repeat protein [Microbulbifer salipaludis]MBN8430624.1 tetratricopeptide repeat protein [Microbulbifer salipaludis]